MPAPSVCRYAGVMRRTGLPVSWSLNTRKNTRSTSGDRSKSQWNTRVCIVPSVVIKMSIAVRRLVWTNCTPLTAALLPLGVVVIAVICVMPVKSRETPSSSFCGS